jgi:hypothetical protein
MEEKDRMKVNKRVLEYDRRQGLLRHFRRNKQDNKSANNQNKLNKIRHQSYGRWDEKEQEINVGQN